MYVLPLSLISTRGIYETYKLHCDHIVLLQKVWKKYPAE
jgi:hypothetical protein